MLEGASEALTTLAVGMVFFIAIGLRRNLISAPDIDFWHAGGRLTERQLAATWSAGGISLGLTILYYMAMTSIFGWRIFIISIATYLTGQLVVSTVLSRWRIREPNFQGTLDGIVIRASGTSFLPRFALLSGLFSVLAMLYAELHFSVIIIDGLLGIASPWPQLVLFVLSSTVIASYACLGGMPAVVESDRWQLLLVLGAMLALFLMMIGLFASGIRPALDSDLSWIESDIRKPDTLSYTLFGLAANVMPLFCQAPLWQMVTSSDPRGVRRGTAKGIVRMFSLFTFVIFVAFMLNGSGKVVDARVLLESMGMLGQFGTHLLLPLLFVGLLAAMFSTADNLLLGAAFGIKRLVDQSGSQRWSEVPPAIQRIILIGGIMLLQCLTYYTVTHLLAKEFMSYFLSLVFYLFSQAAPLGLVVLIAVAAPEHLRKGTMTSIGVSIAWLIDFAAFTYAVSHSAPKVQLMATPVAIVFTLACIYTRKLSAPRPVVAGEQEKGLP